MTAIPNSGAIFKTNCAATTTYGVSSNTFDPSLSAAGYPIKCPKGRYLNALCPISSYQLNYIMAYSLHQRDLY